MLMMNTSVVYLTSPWQTCLENVVALMQGRGKREDIFMHVPMVVYSMMNNVGQFV